MLNLLFNIKKAERHPFEIFIIALIYSSFSILFATWIFPDYSSIAMVFLTVFSCIYLIQKGMKIEESKELSYKSERWILKEHSKMIILLLSLFLGFVVSFTVWSFVLPTETMSHIFELQEKTVEGIRAIIATGSYTNAGAFSAILINNLKVMLISLIFAIFYGAGSVYILVWNASVMGFVIGNLARDTLGVAALPLAFSKYFIHGIPEMVAYFITALAGGILYFAIWRGDFGNDKKRNKLILDVSILIGISIFILIIAGLIEIFISPYI